MWSETMTKVVTIFKPTFIGRPQKYDNRQVIRGESWSRYELFQ